MAQSDKLNTENFEIKIIDQKKVISPKLLKYRLLKRFLKLKIWLKL